MVEEARDSLTLRSTSIVCGSDSIVEFVTHNETVYAQWVQWCDHVHDTFPSLRLQQNMIEKYICQYWPFVDEHYVTTHARQRQISNQYYMWYYLIAGKETDVVVEASRHHLDGKERRNAMTCSRIVSVIQETFASIAVGGHHGSEDAANDYGRRAGQTGDLIQQWSAWKIMWLSSYPSLYMLKTECADMWNTVAWYINHHERALLLFHHVQGGQAAESTLTQIIQHRHQQRQQQHYIRHGENQNQSTRHRNPHGKHMLQHDQAEEDDDDTLSCAFSADNQAVSLGEQCMEHLQSQYNITVRHLVDALNAMGCYKMAVRIQQWCSRYSVAEAEPATGTETTAPTSAAALQHVNVHIPKVDALGVWRSVVSTSASHVENGNSRQLPGTGEWSTAAAVVPPVSTQVVVQQQRRDDDVQQNASYMRALHHIHALVCDVMNRVKGDNSMSVEQQHQIGEYAERIGMLLISTGQNAVSSNGHQSGRATYGGPCDPTTRSAAVPRGHDGDDDGPAVHRFMECPICMEHSVVGCTVPCGHVFCDTCGREALKQKKCFVCDKEATNFMRIYISGASMWH